MRTNRKRSKFAIKDKYGTKTLDYAEEYEKLKGTDAYNLLQEKTLFNYAAETANTGGIDLGKPIHRMERNLA
jgi:hypothetical protein